MAKKLQDFPLRECHSMHDCCICHRTILNGQMYFDGGYGKRAHEHCALRGFGNCNVCGRKLHTADEDEMGLCGGCTGEWRPTARECEGL